MEGKRINHGYTGQRDESHPELCEGSSGLGVGDIPVDTTNR